MMCIEFNIFIVFFCESNRAHRIGGNAFALFTNSQRQWNAADKPITQSEFDDMQTHLKECGIEPGMVLPHGSYLINLGSPEDDKLQKSRNFFLKEVSRVRGLGLQLYNFHPGSTLGKITEEECCDRVADSVNWLHKQEDSGDVVILLENTAGQGNKLSLPLALSFANCILFFLKSVANSCLQLS